MYTIKIQKNGDTIKTINCDDANLEKCYDIAYDIAGGMWNGKDDIRVVVDKK
jgi:hypothetical protein